ncbi:crotonase/enoyl-CoA hydratase family protein [Roseibium denhamense]|uniref:Methylglutaconyl-CoA hydratase n=1 Tax=Roseibium denhamense TaxID=76305 RepID=A0ABY1P7Y0_9HYPH|nr:crotonase/enoyl-CoA hydratase family protein [Roseibium denhamense]MTI04549.1 crotonase/enoyl-CoA hydratase family protein [Roseibium denhamense]SMP28414.1 methylglutaconyl-CoA hydratase [Roseibium denhamense]
MSYATISLTSDERGVATLTLNRPDKHNALSALMISELTEAAQALGRDETVRVVVLTGAGSSFCAGGDLEWMREQFQASRTTRMSEARKLAAMLQALNEMPKPLIGRVQGQAFGGGIGMMSVCDTVVAVDTAKFGLTEVRLGLIPATISPYVLARMGEGKARRVFMSARIFGTEEAREMDLIAKAVSGADMDAAIEAEIKPYLGAAPAAVAAAKALARSLGPAITAEVIDDTIRQLADAWETPEAQEGISAFFEKRKPSWVAQ